MKLGTYRTHLVQCRWRIDFAALSSSGTVIGLMARGSGSIVFLGDLGSVHSIWKTLFLGFQMVQLDNQWRSLLEYVGALVLQTVQLDNQWNSLQTC